MTKKYFLHDGNKEISPFSIEELSEMKLKRIDMVWFNGLEDWQEAASIEELQNILINTSPPIIKKEEVKPPLIKPESDVKNSHSSEYKSVNHIQHSKKQTSGLWKVLALLLAIAAIGTYLYSSKNYSASSTSSNQSYEQKVISVEEQEQTNPARFLNATGTYREAVFGKKIKIEGTVTNNATVAKFKDVKIEVRFYTDTKTFLGSERYILYDYFLRSDTKGFELKIKPPRGATTCGWEAIDATPY